MRIAEWGAKLDQLSDQEVAVLGVVARFAAPGATGAQVADVIDLNYARPWWAIWRSRWDTYAILAKLQAQGMVTATWGRDAQGRAARFFMDVTLDWGKD